jgi:hypothetical protein
MPGFALCHTADMFILMILYDFCLLPAQFRYIIVYIRKVESPVQMLDRCAPWKIFNGARMTLLRGRCNFKSNSQLKNVKVQITLRLAVYRQSVCLGDKPLETQRQNFSFQLYTCGHSPHVTCSLTRAWVCRLQLLLALASAVILRSESRGTHGHILLSHIRDSPKLEGQVLEFISPRNRVAQLYPQALGSLFVAFYDSQGYGGVIRPPPHGITINSSQKESYFTTQCITPARITQKTCLILLHVLSLPRKRVHWVVPQQRLL